MPFASNTVPGHLLRGAVGLAAVILAIAFASATPLALIGLPVAVVAWRGCPTCWAVGLAQTRERARCACVK